MTIVCKRVFFAFVLSLILMPMTLLSQGGGSSVPFLRISPDARASGMGETGTAIADNANAVFWNPGGLGFLEYHSKGSDYEDPLVYRQLSLSFSPWLPQFNADLYYSYGTYAQHIEDVGTVAANLVFMNLGEFQRTLQSGVVVDKFNSSEFTFSLAFGTKITNDMGLGVNLKFIRSNLTPQTATNPAGAGNSAALDIGLLWKPSKLGFMEDNLSLGFNLQNLGPKITYINQADPLPTMLRLGGAYKFYSDEFNELTLAIDVVKLLVNRDSVGGSDPVPISLVTGWRRPGIEVGVGIEYWYEKIVAMRAGYFNEPSNLGNRKYWNLGAGIRYKIFQLDFGYILTIEQNHPLANTMRFSALVNFR